MNPPIGILPAAGIASRLRPLRYPKELLPIIFTRDPRSGRPQPIVSAEYSLIAMREAGIKKCIVIINESKTEILKYFGNGSDVGLDLVYAIQSQPAGLPQAIATVRHWIGGDSVCLALPDTIFRPRHAIAGIGDELLRSHADLVLGVFPTQEPQNLGPVRVTDGGRVLEVQDKPAETDLRNTWGIAVWTPRFTELLTASVARWATTGATGKERVLGEVFDEAVRSDLHVQAVVFERGAFIDVGKPEGINAVLLEGADWWEAGA